MDRTGLLFDWQPTGAIRVDLVVDAGNRFATVLAFASIVGLVPQVILGPFVGPLIDRWNRKRTMIVADAVVGLSTTVLVYLFATDTIAVWHVFVALFVRALGGAFHWPAMTASTTSLMVLHNI